MAGQIERKPILFTVLVAVTVLAGSIVMMAYPMLRKDMHPRLETLKPYTPLQLAGRDVYQREGCVNCHTQTVRPLRTEVMRYGDYSKAGEFAFDHPFLWGSKRTGPDLAREGGKRPNPWHYAHYRNPRDPQFNTPLSNMPAYPWLDEAKLDVASVRAHMTALGFPATEADYKALEGKTEMDALVAYTQQLGHAVPKAAPKGGVPLDAVNPLGTSPEAAARGQAVFASKDCSVCHGAEGRGDVGIGPSLVDATFLGVAEDGTDGGYFDIIALGSDAKPMIGRPGNPDGGMPAYATSMTPDEIWSIVSWIRSQQQAAKPQQEKKP